MLKAKVYASDRLLLGRSGGKGGGGLALGVSRRREDSNRLGFLCATASLISERTAYVVKVRLGREKMQVQTAVCSRRLG
jgi:hypothetical protein